MKTNKILFFGAALAGVLGFSGCSDDFQYDTLDGDGRVLLRPVINSDVEVKSRAGETTDQLAESAIIWISNSKGVVRKYTGIDNVPAAGINLTSDNYVAEVWAGDSVPASFDHRQFKGLEKFTVSKGSTQQVEIVCTVANSVVTIDFSDEVKELIKDPVLTVGHKAGSLEWNGFDDALKNGYFMMPSFDPDLAYTLKATDVATGREVTVTDVIADAQPATRYILSVKHTTADPEEFGGALFTIEVDATEIEKKDEFVFYSAPEIKGTNFDIDVPVSGKRGSLTEKKLWIAATSPLTNVVVSCPEFEQLLGIGGHDFDVLNMTGNVASQLASIGFSYQLFTHTDNMEVTEAERNFQEMKIVFDETFLALFPDGEYNIAITATDENKRTATQNVTVKISDDKVTTAVAKSADIWPTTAVLRGTVVQENITGLGFDYRESGSQQWETALWTDASTARRRAPRTLTVGSEYTVELTGLNPSTTYEYRAVCEGFEGSVETFTTWADEKPQLPNAGFEEWNTSGKAHLICADESSMFWDSGNHGSATMNKNVTQRDETIKHGGNYSAKLTSQFVGIGTIGKFAAGNLFAGKYLKTDGTDGELGFGRPFTGRPRALKGYVRYEPGTVNQPTKNFPSSELKGEIEFGKPDKGQIYVALTDNSNDKTYLDFTAPFIIKTKTKELFDPTASNVIAYGQMTFTEATPGSGMVEFTIPLEYSDRNANEVGATASIVLVCSASKGGDYFAGGDSTMWVDDLELVY